jgi:hypothetical protein
MDYRLKPSAGCQRDRPEFQSYTIFLDEPAAAI